MKPTRVQFPMFEIADCPTIKLSDLKRRFKDEAEIIKEEMKQINTEAEFRKYFISILNDGRDLAILRRIVETNFPHYLEMLDKLLILK